MEKEQSIVYGNENFHYAKINKSADGNYNFAEPVAIPGMRKFTMSVEQNTKGVPGDNKTVLQIPGKKKREATGTFLQLTQDYAAMIGFYKNSNGMITDTGRQEPHAIFFEELIATETTESRRLHILYHVTAGEPSIETETLDEEPEEREIEFEYKPLESRFVKDENGKAVQYAYIDRTEENKAIYDTFKTKVLLPTDGLTKGK